MLISTCWPGLHRVPCSHLTCETGASSFGCISAVLSSSHGSCYHVQACIRVHHGWDVHVANVLHNSKASTQPAAALHPTTSTIDGNQSSSELWRPVAKGHFNRRTRSGYACCGNAALHARHPSNVHCLLVTPTAQSIALFWEQPKTVLLVDG